MQKKYLSITEVSIISGLSKSFWYHKSAKREIPMIKIGIRVLLPQESFFAWLEKHRVDKNIQK